MNTMPDLLAGFQASLRSALSAEQNSGKEALHIIVWCRSAIQILLGLQRMQLCIS